MTMPSDTRLVGAVRDLAVHAAKYAQAGDGAAAILAEHVARAAAMSIEAVEAKDAAVEVRFAGDASRLEVQIACEAAHGKQVPESRSEAGLTVDWSRSGSRQICLIAHRLGF
ncbi:MAG: hypothetical protein ABR606_00020 [Vicinamibacterales bacterium]